MNPIDILAIHEVLARAVSGLDQRNVALMEPCFTVDARFELEIKGAGEIPPFVGRAAIMKLMTDSMNSHTEDRRHVISNIFFESAEAESANVVSNLVAFQSEHGKINVMTSGVYRDLMKKVDGKWQIAVRRLALDVPF
jgi:hypothetical protein